MSARIACGWAAPRARGAPLAAPRKPRLPSPSTHLNVRHRSIVQLRVHDVDLRPAGRLDHGRAAAHIANLRTPRPARRRGSDGAGANATGAIRAMRSIYLSAEAHDLALPRAQHVRRDARARGAGDRRRCCVLAVHRAVLTPVDSTRNPSDGSSQVSLLFVCEKHEKSEKEKGERSMMKTGKQKKPRPHT